MIVLYRLSRWLYLHDVPLLPELMCAINRILFATVLPPSAQVGRGVVLGYRVLGIALHRQAYVGDHVNLGSKATIGSRAGIPGASRVEHEALIDSGARVLGPVRVGRGAQVGANGVVLHDVPDGATAVGVPARIIARKTPLPEQSANAS